MCPSAHTQQKQNEFLGGVKFIFVLVVVLSHLRSMMHGRTDRQIHGHKNAGVA
jgi:hypothetical protein